MSNYQPPGGPPPYGGPPQQPGAPGTQYADLPQHARERLEGMKKTHFFTSDLSVNEFLLVKQAGFEPLGLVMGSSIYNISSRPPQNLGQYEPGREIVEVTQALYHARELAMTRMEEEADELGADGVVGVRMDVNLHAWGQSVAEFIAVGTAVRHATGQSYRNAQGKPFQSGLSGQDFWTLLRSGYRPVGFVMGNCVYYVRPEALIVPNDARNGELSPYTHCLYDARELAMERLQAEAEDVQRHGHRRRRDRGEGSTPGARRAASSAATPRSSTARRSSSSSSARRSSRSRRGSRRPAPPWSSPRTTERPRDEPPPGEPPRHRPQRPLGHRVSHALARRVPAARPRRRLGHLRCRVDEPLGPHAGGRLAEHRDSAPRATRPSSACATRPPSSRPRASSVCG